MADPTTSLRVRISADLADIKQGLAVLRGDLAKVKSEAAKSGPNTSSWVNGLKAARQQVMAFVAAYASLRTVSVFATLSDEATQLRGRLQAAGAGARRGPGGTHAPTKRTGEGPANGPGVDRGPVCQDGAQHARAEGQPG